MENNIALVVGRNNRDVYQYLDSDTYKNLSNGKIGRIREEDAKRLFSIPITLNRFAQENPAILKLIGELGLSLEKNNLE